MSDRTPLERAALAIVADLERQSKEPYAAREGPGICLPCGAEEDEERGLFKVDGAVDVPAIARAVLQAIREPSEAMANAVVDSEFGAIEGVAGSIWATMIDAALAEQPNVVTVTIKIDPAPWGEVQD